MSTDTITTPGQSANRGYHEMSTLELAAALNAAEIERSASHTKTTVSAEIGQTPQPEKANYLGLYQMPGMAAEAGSAAVGAAVEQVNIQPQPDIEAGPAQTPEQIAQLCATTIATVAVYMAAVRKAAQNNPEMMNR